jgi:hypothetical protein
LLVGSVNVINLEFDLPSAPPAIPVPGIFLELNRDAELPAKLLAILATQILDAPLPESINATLIKCCDALPPGARIIHLGALRSRSPQQLRLVVSRISPSLLVRYLDSVGWTGNRKQLFHSIARFSPFIDSMALSLDVGSSVGDRIGLECFLNPSRHQSGRWQTLFGRLGQDRLCTEGKARGLLAWPGICQKGTCGELWPPSLAWGDNLMGPARSSIFVRFLSHVKLVSRSDEPLSAKCYLGFAHYWHSLLNPGSSVSETGLL